MFFRKDVQVASPLPPVLRAWGNEDRGQQRLRLSVTDWHYGVSPHLQSRAAVASWEFSFDGLVLDGAMKGLAVTGRVEMLEPPNELPRVLMERWKPAPKAAEGYGFLINSESFESGAEPGSSFGLTLYCKAEAFEWIYRAFANGSFGRDGGTHIELGLDTPNSNAKRFWHKQWRDEWLRVTGWKVMSTSQLHAPRIAP